MGLAYLGSPNTGAATPDAANWSLPTGYTRATTRDRSEVTMANLAAILTSGRLQLVAIRLVAGDVVSNISFISGSAGATSPTAQWFELRDSSRNLLGATSDNGATAWSTFATKTLALGTPYTVPTTGLYYLGICVVATTPPTLLGVNTSSVISGLAPVLAGFANTGLTTPASTPTTASALTATAVPYALVS